MATSVADLGDSKSRRIGKPQSVLTWFKPTIETTVSTTPSVCEELRDPVVYDGESDIKPGTKEGVEYDAHISTKKSRNVVMTLNNYTDVEVEALRLFGKRNCSYLVFGYEIAPKTGTPHLQIYAEFSEGKTWATIKSQCYSNRYYIASRRGTAKQASSYCIFEDYPKCEKENKYEVFGEISKQGQRAEFDEVIAFSKTHNRVQTIREFPYMFARMWTGMNALLDAVEEEYRPTPFPSMRKWQQELFDYLSQSADDRTIVWVEDATGGSGKSQFCNRYLDAMLGFTSLGGRMEDMAQIYRKTPGAHVYFDIAKEQINFCDHYYVVAEQLKGGKLISSKYDGKVMRFRPPHVVFFSNYPPPEDQWIEDRLKHIVLDGSESNVKTKVAHLTRSVKYSIR